MMILPLNLLQSMVSLVDISFCVVNEEFPVVTE